MTPTGGIPFSDFASPAAARTFAALATDAAPSLDSGVEELRAYYGALDHRRAEEMQRRFDVDIDVREMAGVPVQVITPREGVTAANAQRVLVNLHGGAFMWGRGDGGLVESIPIAAIGKFKVVAVDYGLGPENVFPAASRDVASVYTELLRDYDAASIGIYGCSAGGVLTAQVVAWLVRIGLPTPGAIGTFCGSGLEFDGDSSHLALLTGKGATSTKAPIRLQSLPYFRDASPEDPLVFPLASDEFVGRFPPTLVIAGGRDFAASSLTLAHRRLVAAGRQSRLFVFDGLWHAFFADPQLPESAEAYDLICRFFLEYLRSHSPSLR